VLHAQDNANIAKAWSNRLPEGMKSHRNFFIPNKSTNQTLLKIIEKFLPMNDIQLH
tara:strand:- start:521 stop:688 length:168 start_codon:yes stop_codon:yes gene_type:complete